MDKRSLLAMASILGFGARHAAAPQIKPARIRTKKRYPEQSSRQAMRGFRRARRGPGIVLDGTEYVARA